MAMAFVLPWSPVFVATLTVTVLHPTIACALFIRRRHLFPISGHSVLLVIASTFFLSAQNVITQVGGVFNDEIPCAATLIFVYLGQLLAANVILARAWRVWHRYLLADERIQIDLNFEKNTSTWFSDHAHWFSDMRCFAAGVGLGLFEWFSIMGIFLRNPTFEETASTGCESFELAGALFVIWIVWSVILVCYTMYRVRHVHDGYYLKRELGQVALIGFGTVILSMTQYAVGFAIPWQHYRVIFWVFMQSIVYVMVTEKVRLSYKGAYAHSSSLNSRTFSVASNDGVKKHKRRRLSRFDLGMVFADATLLEHFVDHLKREFSAENLIFYQAATKFYARCQPADVESGIEPAERFQSEDERNRMAAKIYAEFIVEGAPAQVNLDASIPRAICAVVESSIRNFDITAFFKASLSNIKLDSIQTVPQDIFEPARRKIFMLMAQDTFVRFKSHLRRTLSVEERRELEERVSRRCLRLGLPEEEENDITVKIPPPTTLVAGLDSLEISPSLNGSAMSPRFSPGFSALPPTLSRSPNPLSKSQPTLSRSRAPPTPSKSKSRSMTAPFGESVVSPLSRSIPAAFGGTLVSSHTFDLESMSTLQLPSAAASPTNAISTPRPVRSIAGLTSLSKSTPSSPSHLIGHTVLSPKRPPPSPRDFPSAPKRPTPSHASVYSDRDKNASGSRPPSRSASPLPDSSHTSSTRGSQPPSRSVSLRKAQGFSYSLPKSQSSSRSPSPLPDTTSSISSLPLTSTTPRRRPSARSSSPLPRASGSSSTGEGTSLPKQQDRPLRSRSPFPRPSDSTSSGGHVVVPRPKRPPRPPTLPHSPTSAPAEGAATPSRSRPGPRPPHLPESTSTSSVSGSVPLMQVRRLSHHARSQPWNESFRGAKHHSRSRPLDEAQRQQSERELASV